MILLNPNTFCLNRTLWDLIVIECHSNYDWFLTILGYCFIAKFTRDSTDEFLSMSSYRWELHSKKLGDVYSKWNMIRWKSTTWWEFQKLTLTQHLEMLFISTMIWRGRNLLMLCNLGQRCFPMDANGIRRKV